MTFSKFAYLSNIVLSGDGLCWQGSRPDVTMSSGSGETGWRNAVVSGSSFKAWTPVPRLSPRANSTVLLFLASKSSFLFLVVPLVRSDSSTLFLRFLAAYIYNKYILKLNYSLWYITLYNIGCLKYINVSYSFDCLESLLCCCSPLG